MPAANVLKLIAVDGTLSGKRDVGKGIVGSIATRSQPRVVAAISDVVPSGAGNAGPNDVCVFVGLNRAGPAQPR